MYRLMRAIGCMLECWMAMYGDEGEDGGFCSCIGRVWVLNSWLLALLFFFDAVGGKWGLEETDACGRKVGSREGGLEAHGEGRECMGLMMEV